MAIVRSVWTPDRTEIAVERGMVVAKHPVAAAAGIEMLQDGGNAADAAAAMGFTLAVVKPMWTSLGGIGYLLAHDAARGEQWCFDGAPRAPLAARPDSYEVLEPSSTGIALYHVRGDANDHGHTAAAVPGNVAILCGAHQRLGRLPLGRVLEPAIRAAAEGVAVDWNTTLFIAAAMPKLQQNAAAAAVFLPGGVPPSFLAGVFRQSELAETLRRIARDGADGFYRGEVAHAIADDMRANGGWITEEDLARYPRRVDAPLRVHYRDVTALIPPMPCGATTAAETLRILDRFDVAGAGHNTVAGLHLFIEAARRAYADRFHYLADPESAPVPLAGLLSDGHADELAALVARDHVSMRTPPGAPEPWVRFGEERPEGDPWQFEPDGVRAKAATGAPGRDADDCTTHYAVVDADRNAICCTMTTAGIFGAGVVTPGTGVSWNNGMTWFNPLPGTANSIAPGKRALTNMTPVIVLRDGAPYLLVGAPGGRKIINAVTQIISNVVDHGLGMQAAVTAPRVDASQNVVLADERLDPVVVHGLEALGHRVQSVLDGPGAANFSRPLAILVDPADGRAHSGTTPFHLSEAWGY